MSVLHAEGAYGAVYNSIQQVDKDWEDGVDFHIINGPYFSVRDTNKLVDMGFDSMLLRIGNDILYRIRLLA